MGHGAGVVMCRQTLAAERGVTTAIITLDIRSEIVDITAELNRVSRRNDVIAFTIERIACTPKRPLRKRIHVVGIGELTDLRLHRRLKGDGQTRVTFLIHIP